MGTKVDTQVDQSCEGDLTKQRTLRESVSVWSMTPHIRVMAAKHPPEPDYDVIVVGAGISGALVAHALADGRRRVLVVDRRQPITGSTMASTAMIQHELDVPLYELARLAGTDNAERAWRRSVRAVDDLVTIVDELGIHCGMKRKKALYLAGTEHGSRALAMEVEARHAAGIGAEYLVAGDLQSQFGIDRTAAIVSHASASANPAQLTAGLLRAARGQGATTVRGVEITDVREEGERVLVATADGQILGARHVVFCTGYEYLEAVADQRHSIVSTWALATRPGVSLPPWLSSYVVWEAASPYLYFRTSRDGRLIVGGEDEHSQDAYLSKDKLRSKTATIRDKLGELLDCRIPAAEFTWAAAFGTTPSGLPFIDTAPGMERVHAVMGFGGNGITFSRIAADVIAAAVQGQRDPDADLFAFSREFDSQD